MNPADTVVFAVGVFVAFIAFWGVVASGVLQVKQRLAETEADAPPEAQPEEKAIRPDPDAKPRGDETSP